MPERRAPERRGGGGEVETPGKVFVGGLNPNTTAESMHAYFSRFGLVSDAAVVKDAVTKKSRGFGFVEFEGGIPPGMLDLEHIVDKRRCSARVHLHRAVSALR